MQHTYKNPQLARGELFSKPMTIATPKMAQYVLDALTDKEVRIFLANFSQTVTMLKKNNVKSFDADQLIMMVQRLAEQFPFEFGNVMTPSFKYSSQTHRVELHPASSEGAWPIVCKEMDHELESGLADHLRSNQW